MLRRVKDNLDQKDLLRGGGVTETDLNLNLEKREVRLSENDKGWAEGFGDKA